MSNNFIAMQNIARELLPLLKENLVMPATVNRNYSGDFIGKGNTIIVEKPAVFVADEFGGTINLQNIVEPSVAVKMDKIADVSFAIEQKELALSMSEFKTKYLASAANSIAEKINRDGLSLYKRVPFFTGTAGTTPSTITAFTQARKTLNDNKVPLMDRYAAWDTAAEAKFLELDAILNAEKSGSTEALRAGAIGDIVGFKNYMSQAIPTHTAGTYTSLADVKATVNIASNGQLTDRTPYSVMSFASTAGASTGTLKAGDLLTVAGKKYVVLEDVAAAVAGATSAKVYPALKANITTQDVTFADVTAGGHVANLAYHKDAFIFVTRPLAPYSDKESYTVQNEGWSIRVSIWSDPTTKKTMMSLDVLYDYVCAYPELAAIVLG
jgi:hypothetical protein